MALDPLNVNTKSVDQLPTADFSVGNFITHSEGPDLKKNTIQAFADFLSPLLGTMSGVGFRAVTVPDGGTLPSTTQEEFILVGAGTFENVGGGSQITTTEQLNALVSNGTYWFIGVEIPITAEALGITQYIRSGFLGTVPSEDAVFNALASKLDTADISAKEDKTNKQNDLSYDGTGVKYSSIDGVNDWTRKMAKVATKTGLLSKFDTFDLEPLTTTTLRIKAVSEAMFWNELFIPATSPSAAIKSFAQKDYALDQLITATGGNVNVNPLATDGKYIRYIGYDKNGNIYSSLNTFTPNNDVLQLGFVTVLKIGSSVVFLDGTTAGARNVFSRPDLASNTDFDKVASTITNVTIGRKSDASFSTSTGTITGISVNWKGLANPSNGNPIDVVNYAGLTTATFAAIDPTFLTSTSAITPHTLITESDGGIPINQSFFNTTTQLRGTMANGSAGVARIMIGVRGGVFWQMGEFANTACYPDLATAKSNIYSHVFSDAIIPPGVAYEIARIAFTKSASVTNDDNQFYVANTGGGGAGSTSSIPPVSDATTATKGIIKLANEIGGTADLPTVNQKLKTDLIITASFSGSGLTVGETIPAGTFVDDLLREAFSPYVNPVFSSFSVSGQATTIEVGTILSGSKTFTWAIIVNSGVISTIDIYDNTAASTLLAGTPNDGSQAQTITSIQLNADGSTQSWKGIGNNTSPVGTINSSNFVVTSRFNRWWGAVADYPTVPSDGVGNRTYAQALPNNAFKTSGVNAFTLVTGTTHNRFIVLLPPGVTITSVIDTTNANTNITSSYVLSTLTVNDAGGTSRAYNMYQYTTAIPYSTSANHSITTI